MGIMRKGFQASDEFLKPRVVPKEVGECTMNGVDCGLEKSGDLSVGVLWQERGQPYGE